MSTQNQPIVNQPFLYANNGVVQWGSNTTLTITSAQFRDSGNDYDIILSSNTTLNAASNGVNGLDTGSLANATWYYVFLIGDSTNFHSGATLLSTSASSPVMPSGYDVIKLIGYALTDGSAHFLKFYTAGTNSFRYHVWDADISVLNSGSATSLTAISLAGAVPPVDYIPVQIDVDFTPNVAGDKVSFAPFGSSATLLPHIHGSVATKPNSGQLKIMSRLDSGAAKILYINSAASGDADVWVSGFEYFV